MNTYEIPQEDWDEVMRLSKEAARTPVIAMSVKDGMEGRDFASMARERVYSKWREIGDMLGFDGSSVSPVDESRRLVRATPIEERGET